jgi:hypothetical protein
LTNVTRWPMLIVISSGVMPAPVIVTVGVVDTAVGGGAGAAAGGGGVGETGDDPPPHPAIIVRLTTKTKRRDTGMMKMPGGASGTSVSTVSRLPQRGDRIDRSRPAGRKEAGQQRDRTQHRRDGHERERIENADAVDQP